MPFSVAYFLIPFAVVVFLAGLFVFFNVFHVLRFGIESTGTYAIVTLYVVGFALILGASAFLLSRYDWNQKIDPATILHLNTGSSNIYGL